MSCTYFDPSFDPELILFTGIPENDAEVIATRYGLSSERVLKILQNLLEIDMYKWGDPYVTVLEEALKCMHGNQAVELFENCDLEKLKNRYSTYVNTSYHREVNIYPFEKFTSRLKNYIKYQTTVKERLVETGFVNYKVSHNVGLNRCLISLYYVKPYYEYMIFSSEKDFQMFIDYYKLQNISKKKYAAYHKLIRNYTYIDYIDNLKRFEGFYIDEDILYIGSGFGILAHLKPYEEVEYFDFLPDGMGKKLDDLRPKVFEMRLEVLKILLNAIKNEDVQTLWEDCTNQILSMNFTHNEAKVLLSADRILSCQERVPTDHYFNVMVHSAGLTDLFYVIGFMENEIINRTEQKISEIWQENPIKDRFTSYFKTLDHPEKDKISRMLDGIIEMENIRKDYIDSFNERVKNFIEKTLNIQGTIISPKRDELILNDYIRRYPEFRKRYEELHQDLVTVKPLNSQQEEDYKRYKYRCRDEVEIPGTTAEETYTILINEDEFNLEINYFLIFLKLVMELKLNQKGWVDTQGLMKVVDISIPQAIYNLGKKVERSLQNEDRKKFFEHKDKKGYRISTHPDFIKYNKEKLLKHEDDRIRKLAEKLPD